MSRFFQAILVGLFTTFIVDFFLFLGIYLHFIKPNEIDIYYNVLFSDHQNPLYYAIGTLFYGVIFIYLHSNRVKIALVLLTSLLLLAMITPTLANYLAKIILVKEDTTIEAGRFLYIGDIYYDGRDSLYFYDKEIDKLVKIDKKEIKQ